MLYLRRVVGNSMAPTLKHGQVVLVLRVRDFKAGDVVVAFMDRREVIKRVSEYVNGQAFLLGDNEKASTDSRHHGWLVDRHIEGKVIWPRTRKKN